jgi:hypothetical protein
MCAEMVATEVEEAKKHALLKKHGYNLNVSVERGLFARLRKTNFSKCNPSSLSFLLDNQRIRF